MLKTGWVVEDADPSAWKLTAVSSCHNDKHNSDLSTGHAMRQIKRSIMKLLQIIMIWRRRNSWTDVRVSLVWYPFEP